MVETDEAAVISFALGLRQLQKPRRLANGMHLEGDFRAAEALDQPTDEERSAAEVFTVESEKKFKGGLIPMRPLKVVLDDSSVMAVAAAVRGDLLPESPVTRPTRRR